MRNFNAPQKILDAVTATGVGNPFKADDWDTILLQLATASSANFTVKFQASLAAVCPNFGAAASPSNPWFYVDVVDYGTNNVIAGGTGVSSAGTDLVNGYEVNVNGARWINANVTNYAAGAITVEVNGFSQS